MCSHQVSSLVKETQAERHARPLQAVVIGCHCTRRPVGAAGAAGGPDSNAPMAGADPMYGHAESRLVKFGRMTPLSKAGLAAPIRNAAWRKAAALFTPRASSPV